MDPLSIAAAASSLVFSVVRNGKALATIYEKYQDAQRCLFLIQTECTVLAAALSQLHTIFSKTTKSAMNRYPGGVVEALDLSLLGCTLTLSVLDREVDSLVDSANGANMGKGKRAKYLWKEETMNDLLQQLRGQSSALSLLLRALDSSSIDQILTIVRSGQPTFQKVREEAKSIRLAHPQEHYAESIAELTFDDSRTLYSLDTSYDSKIDSIATKLQASALSGNSTQSHHQRALKVHDNTVEDIDFTPWRLDSHAKFQAALDSLRREELAPALAIGVLSSDSSPKVYVSGYRCQNSSSRVTRADRFFIPTSGLFTTTVLAVLVDRGTLRWEETVLELLPALSSRIDASHHHTTLAMLTAHCSGLKSRLLDDENGDLFRHLRRVDAKKGRFAVASSYLGRPAAISPGTKRRWDWVNSFLIALIVEQRTSKSLESLVKELVLDPLEMYSAGFIWQEADKNSAWSSWGSSRSEAGSNVTPTQPWGHSVKAKARTIVNAASAEYYNVPAFSAHTGLHCSAPDYASFVSMHLRAAMGMPTQVLQSESLSRLYRRFSDTDAAFGGWEIRSNSAGGEELVDGGTWCGFYLQSTLVPSEGKAYFAIANLDGDDSSQVIVDAIELAMRHTAD